MRGEKKNIWPSLNTAIFVTWNQIYLPLHPHGTVSMYMTRKMSSKSFWKYIHTPEYLYHLELCFQDVSDRTNTCPNSDSLTTMSPVSCICVPCGFFSYQEGNRRRCILWLANLTVIFLDSLGQVTKTSGTNGQKKFKICIEVFLFPFALSQSISLLTKRARGDKEHNKDEMRGKDL